jgi:hypothetical protein
MKTQVEFRSGKFPPCEGEQERINPGLWARRLAEYFVPTLSEKGIKTKETNFFRSLRLDVLRSIVQSRVISLPGHCIDQTNEKPLRRSHDNAPLFIS